MDRGWIKLPRIITEHWVFERGTDGSYAMEHYWLDLLLAVNHREGKSQYFSRVITIQPGQTRTSLRKLSSRWGIDKDTVKKVLDTFQNEGMLTYETKYNSTVITIDKHWVERGLKGDFTDTLSDTLSDTVTDTLSDTLSDTVSDAVSDAVSPLTRSKELLKNDNKKERTKEAAKPQIFDPWGEEVEGDG